MTETQTETVERPDEPPRWSRRRKWTVALAAVVLLTVAGVVGCTVLRTDPEDVVRDYLDALRSGDAEAALEFVGDVSELGTASEVFLTDKAMARDWTVTKVVPRKVYEESATFDVTITAADKTSSTGRFAVDGSGPDGWRIENPLVRVDLSELPMGYAEFNGEVADAATIKGSDPVFQNDLKLGVFAWLFPGAYTAFGDSDGLELPTNTYVAVPGSTGTVETKPRKFLPEITVTDDFVAEAHAQLKDLLDECAKSTEVNPPGCPFAGGYGLEGSDVVSLDDGQDYSVEKVKWKIEAYPKIRLMQTVGWFAVVEVEPGEVTISGKGSRDYEEDSEPRAFSGGCAIDLDYVLAELTEPGTFTFRFPRGASHTCSQRYG